MARIIFTSRFLKGASKRQIKNLVNYMATRPGVEKLKNNFSPATENQKKFIEEQCKTFPDIKDSFEYEDYQKNPTVSNASELISSIAEKYNNDPAGLKNYVDYIAKRPRAERSEQGHGLWSGSNETISLSKAAEEVANHEGIVWTHVISLRLEDADRLGYDNADAWRKLVKSKIPVIAKSMNIPVDKLKWYGAFHNEGNRPHIHMIVYSEDKKKGYLNTKGIEAMRQAFGTAVFHDDLLHVYEQKDEVRKALKENTEKRIKEIAVKLRQEEKQNPIVASLLLELSKELKQTKGKKQYGWLDTKRKQMVNAIVSELAKDKDIFELYQQWHNYKMEIAKTYQSTPLPCGCLEDEPEFKNIKNLIIQYAVQIGDTEQDQAEYFFKSDSMEQSELEESKFEEINAADTFDRNGQEENNRQEPYRKTNSPTRSRAYQQARAYLEDGNIKSAYPLLLKESRKGNPYALYDLGLLVLKGKTAERDTALAQDYLKRALAGFLHEEQQEHKDSIQYRIGKMYRNGYGTEPDSENAAIWFLKAAEQKNAYAQYALGNLYFYGDGVEQSYEKAYEYYQKAEKQNNPYAAYQLGKLYHMGLGIEKSESKLEDMYRKAFQIFQSLEKGEENQEQKGMLAYRLAKMCSNGQGIDKDKKRAVSYLKIAADADNIYACYDYGCALKKRNPMEAQKYLKKAFDGFLREEATTHNHLLQYKIGKMYYDGNGTQANAEEAAKWFLKAAEQENPYAQYALGSLYVFDKDLKNKELALYWLEKAAENGNEYAVKLIDFVQHPPLSMTPIGATVKLFRDLSRMIENDSLFQQKHFEQTESKLLRKMAQKKAALGQKQTLG